MPAINLEQYGLNEPPDDIEALPRWNTEVLVKILDNTQVLMKSQEKANEKIEELESVQRSCPINILQSWWKVSLAGFGFLSVVFGVTFFALRVYNYLNPG
jgi:hypothetical protein